MCVQPYYGWRCGHRTQSATELPFQPCGPPERYPHEPLCSPLTYDLIVREVPEKDAEDEDEGDAQAPREKWQEGICPACCKVYSRVDEQWYARKAAVIKSGIVSERHLEIIDQQLHDRTISVLEKGQRAGPDHTLHLDEYELKQTVILQEMDRLLADLWEMKIFTLEYLRRYARAELRRTELSQEQNDRFAKRIFRYVKELEAALVKKLASSEADGAARQSPEPDPLSDISGLFDEGEPEGEAGSSGQ